MNTSHTSPRTSTLVPRSRRIGHERGFTLIELMITAAIIAILAAVAIPSYQDSVWKGKRAEAKAAILKTLQAEERTYTQTNTYAIYASGSSPSAAFPSFSADTLATSRYKIDVVQTGVAGACTDNDPKKCVIVVATVINGAADPKCGASLSMDTAGNKVSAVTNTICWK